MLKWLPTRSAMIHMRWAFSLFLFPVYLYALYEVRSVNPLAAALVFICWHLLAYPASNGYNSYFDKDEGSIALVRSPPQTDVTLYRFSLLLETAAVLLAFFVSVFFAIGVFVYGLLSKAYSHPAVRLKKYPLTSFMVVFIFQGAFIFFVTLFALDSGRINEASFSTLLPAGLSCSFLIGASYPLTQIYQHDEDRSRGDKTLSIQLGVKNTFIFSVILFLAGAFCFAAYSYAEKNMHLLYLFLLCTAPAAIHFVWWMRKGVNDGSYLNYRLTMRQTFLGGGGLIACFTIMILSRL